MLHHVDAELRAQRFRISKLHLPDVAADLLLHADFGNGDVKPASERVVESAAFVMVSPDVRQVNGQSATDRVRSGANNRQFIEVFARQKRPRRIATRYDKLASRFVSFVALVAAFLWLK